MAKREWVKAIRKKLPDDMGDCPTLPQEMLDLLASLRAEKGNDLSLTPGAAQHGGPAR